MFSRRFNRRAIIVAAILLVVTVSGGLMFVRGRRAAGVARAPFSDLLRNLDNGTVSAVVVNGDTLDFTTTGGQTFRTVAPVNYVTVNAAFVADLARKHVRFDVQALPDASSYSAGALVLGLGFIATLGFMMYRATSGRIPALESRTREADAETMTVTFADVAGWTKPRKK